MIILNSWGATATCGLKEAPPCSVFLVFYGWYITKVEFGWVVCTQFSEFPVKFLTT